MSDRPEVCPKCKGLLARDSRERWPDAPAILTFHCGTTVVEDSAPNQSDTCKLRCANRQITALTAQLQAAEGKLEAIDLIVDDQRGVRSQGTRLNDIYTILHPTPPAQPAVTVQSAPIGTKAPSIGGGWWFRVEHGWKWNGPDGSGGTFPMPGGVWNGKLILPAPPAGEQSLEPTRTPQAVETKRLGQLFENKFDCYADTGDEGDVVLAMTKDTFVKVVHAEIAALKAKVSELKAISTSK